MSAPEQYEATGDSGQERYNINVANLKDIGAVGIKMEEKVTEESDDVDNEKQGRGSKFPIWF